MKSLLILAGLFLTPPMTHADPSEDRLPDRAGATFSGVVRYVGDGVSVCLGPSCGSAWKRDPVSGVIGVE